MAKSKSTSFAKQFPQLLKEIPKDLTLSEWQQLYRQVIYSMGMRILQRFPKHAVAPPRPSGGGQAAGPPPPPPPKLGSRNDTGHGGSTGGPQPALSIAQAALSLGGSD